MSLITSTRLGIAILLCILPSAGWGQDPMGMSCDFETGMRGWSGDGVLVGDESGRNQVCSLRRKDGEHPEIACRFTVPKNGHVEIRFRVRGMPGGKDLKLRKATRGPKGAGFVNHPVEANGEWVERRHGVRDKDGAGPYERSFALVLREGVGEIQIDDIRAKVTRGDGTVVEEPATVGGEMSRPGAGAPRAVLATREDYWPVGEDAAILIPAGWQVVQQGLPAPVLFSAEGEQIAISVIRESPAQVATSGLAQYAELKATTLAASFPDFEPSPPKSGQIGELPAIFFQGPATVEGVKAEVNGMAIQGKASFYLVLGLVPQGSPTARKVELMRLLRTFRENP